ncbi:MAG: hypothetical protein LBO79_05760 [Zoogloeaceae bacterium]|jgi:hypothetical protein|nr:hypothetical protein [Zoogloeaceae bacterium]
MWWLTDSWTDYLDYWQRSWQEASDIFSRILSQPRAQFFAQPLALPQFFPFLSPSAFSGNDNGVPPSWNDLAAAWQFPRVEAMIEPLGGAGFPDGIGDLARLSMQVFMPWDPNAFCVEALISRGAPVLLTSHETDLLPDIAETQAKK